MSEFYFCQIPSPHNIFGTGHPRWENIDKFPLKRTSLSSLYIEMW
jgi:hypothetical protein